MNFGRLGAGFGRLGAEKASGLVVPATITWAGNSILTAAGGTYTAVPFGAENPNRVLAVAALCRINSVAGAVTAMTIGGVAATQVPGAHAGFANSLGFSDIWYASVPTGISGTVSVTFNNSNVRSAIEVYNIVTTTPTPTNGGNGNVDLAQSVSAALTVPANGVGMAGLFAVNASTSVTWTNATQDDYQLSTDSYGAAHVPSSATVTATLVGGVNNGMSLSLASWGP